MITSLLIGAFTALAIAIFGGGGIQIEVGHDFDKTLKKCVEDDERQEKALEALESFLPEFEEKGEAVAASFHAFLEVDRNYNAQAEDYDVALQAVDESWTASGAFFLDQAFAIRDILTEEEWLKCAEIQDERMDKLDAKAEKLIRKADEKIEKREKKLEEELKSASE